MKKKVFSLVLCLVMCASVLAGCNLFGRDLETYYNTVVAQINYEYSIGAENFSYVEDITKRDLINAYNSYGYSYTQNGYSQEDAVEMTLDSLINRSLMITEVERYYKEAGEELLNDAEKTYLWEETYEAIYDNFRTYYNEILGIEDDTASGDEETSGTIYEAYDKQATLYTKQDGSLGIKKVDIVTNIRDSKHVLKNEGGVVYDVEYQDDEGNYIFKDLIYDNILAYTKKGNTGSTNFRSALNEYMSVVRENYSYLDLDDEKTCFIFELDRIYDILKDNYMVEKYEQIYNRLASSGSTVTNVKVADVVKYYENNVVADYEKYKSDAETFETDILSSSTSPNYINSSEAKYFNVAVIKIAFEEGKKEALDTKLTNGMDINEYYSELLKLYTSANVEIKDASTGEATGKTIGAENLLSQIEDALLNTRDYLDYDTVINDTEKVNEILDMSGVSQSALEEIKEETVRNYVERYNTEIAHEKAEAFLNYYYYYNDDTTYLNQDKLSVFGISNSGEVLYNETYSSANVSDESMEDYEMYNEFQEAIKALYNDGNAKVGDISNVVRGSDGVYILFYAGEVNNLFSGITEDFSLTQKDVLKLANTTFNVFTDKTIFDQIYESLYVDSAYGEYEENSINRLKNSLTLGNDDGIVKHVDKYKDLY